MVAVSALAWTIFTGVMASLNTLVGDDAPIASTPEQGQFRGLSNATTQTEVFHGIPYAEPPLGELRFRRTQPLKPYDGENPRDATMQNKFCLQSTQPTYDEYTDEDVSSGRK